MLFLGKHAWWESRPGPIKHVIQNSQKWHEVGLIVPIFQIKEWRGKVVKESVHGHSANELDPLQVFPGLPASNSYAFFYILYC